ncbi:leukemia inhibitory factor receptor isoform X2 [Triplophysa dalaica]|uniref:leukemia inhibitory factor receptor isoform X2 n=1 Tax=Triplophysa dalaica TaxID=1582913 RepID=UPI0024E02897|nr:leukemia inhibitory factor receptor isoform X2 [Triplophysa dalaica]
MGMSVVWLVLVFSVSLVEATGCIPTTSPQCYKNSTGPSEDFTCRWEDRNIEQNTMYTLYIFEGKTFVLQEKTNQKEKYLCLEQLGTIYKNMEIWVQRQVGNLTCNSTKNSVIFECLAKYSKPQITGMTRSDGILNLTLSKPKDNKSVIYVIRWREIGAEWQNETFETEESTFQDFYTLRLQKQAVYQVQLMRQSKPLLPACESQQALWSDWSIMVDVPIEIRLPPKVHWKETQNTQSRDVHLMWDAPPAEESVGGVTYILNMSHWPCHKPKTLKAVNRTFNTSITFSEAWVSIIARNQVGSSPPQLITIPAVKHLNHCPKHQGNSNKIEKTCLEWYKLEDGETRPQAVNTSRKKMVNDIENEVENFVRHYYFLHIRKSGTYQTVAMCPFYSQEGVPSKGPDNVLFFNVTHESAVVSWLSIPVENQRGFLQQYLIWISGQENTTHHRLPTNETSFLIKNLHPGASYTVSIAGRTNAGEGPNSTANFETPSIRTALSQQDQTILSVCVLGLLCTLICSVVFRRFRSKLLPAVPSPVIPATKSIFRHDESLSQQTEEVHEVVLLQLQEHNKQPQNTTPEQSTLLQDFGLVIFEEEDEEDEEGVTDLSSMKSCCYPNPSYRGQMLHMSDPIHTTEIIFKENDTESTYRNGMFFDTRVVECDETSF